MGMTRKATVGEAIRDFAGKVPADYLVQPACTGTIGHHYCATHPHADVRNNISMTSHVEGRGKHVEVWFCPEHGPEVPG